MSTFEGTVEHYRKYRPGIPDDVATILSAAAPSRRPRRLLDVGTGTGLVAEALIGDFDDIIAADTDAEMLAAAEAALRPELPATSTLLLSHASAEEFEPPAGWQPDLVTICRAFHWLDQETVLQRLDQYVAPDGSVAIFGDNSFWTVVSDWKTAIRSLIQQYLGEQRRAGAGVFQHHNRPYSEILQESPFSVVEEHRVPVHRVWSTESILGYLYSTSFAAPHLFGERLTDFEREAADTLARFSDNDTFDEHNEFLIRIGRRP
ncbi:class I SAM-dependent methyltransferase [Actinoplanes sp. NPDC051346]|uniref:class I SAM-dependent methyltransferase n=1 Tax=Actinoplanes sp. NPDC051346 TaxID=3155048 RepID=UPI00344238E2